MLLPFYQTTWCHNSPKDSNFYIYCHGSLRSQNEQLFINATDTYQFVQILCFWTLSIGLSLSKNTVLCIFQNILETGFCLRLQINLLISA
jgi:hypothetical protein